MYLVSYKNNLDRIPAQAVESTMTPVQFVQAKGISLGNYSLQLNGIVLDSSEQNTTFDDLVAKYDLDSSRELMMAGVKPSIGGNC